MLSEQIVQRMRPIVDGVVALSESFLGMDATQLLPAGWQQATIESPPQKPSAQALANEREQQLQGFEQYIIDSLKTPAVSTEQADPCGAKYDELEMLRQRATQREVKLHAQQQLTSEKLRITETQRLLDQLQPTCDALRGWCVQKNRARIPLSLCLSTLKSLRPHANLTHSQWKQGLETVASICPEFLSIHDNNFAAQMQNIQLPTTVVIDLKTQYNAVRQKLKDYAEDHRMKHSEMLCDSQDLLLKQKNL